MLLQRHGCPPAANLESGANGTHGHKYLLDISMICPTNLCNSGGGAVLVTGGKHSGEGVTWCFLTACQILPYFRRLRQVLTLLYSLQSRSKSGLFCEL